MATAAIIAAGIAAAGTAYSADQQKSAAEKAAKAAGKEGTTWVERRPLFDPEATTLDFLLQEQHRLYEQGAPDYSQIFKGGGGMGGAEFKGVGAKGDEAMDIYRQVAERGLGAADSPWQQMAQGMVGNVWGGQGTGFEGYNPVLHGLAQELGGSSMDTPMGLLLGFLSENDRNVLGQAMTPEQAAAAQQAGGGEGGAPRLTSGGGGGGSFNYNYSGGGGGGVPPDLGRGSGTFATELQKIFDEEGNEEEIAAMLEAVQGDIERGSYAAMADLESRAQGSGRFGGDWHAARIADTKARTAEEIAQISAQLRYGDLEQRRNARLAALNILNSREVAAMSDQTQRAGIASAAGSAAAGRDLQRELAELQHSGLLRGQDLQAIMGMMQGEQFGLGTLAGLGGQLSGDRMGALGLIPQFEGLGLAGLDRALGAGQGITGLEQLDWQASQNQAQAQANAAGRSNAARQQAALAQAAAPQQMLDNYIRNVLNLGGAYNVSKTVGNNPAAAAPYTYQAEAINPYAAGAMAGLGSWADSRAQQQQQQQNQQQVYQ